MAAIVLPNRAAGVRPPFCGVNWGSAQASGLVRWYPLQDEFLRFDAVKPNQVLTLTGARLDRATPLGRLAFKTDNANDTGAVRYATAPTGSDFTNATGWSVAIWATTSVHPGSGNGAGLFSTASSETSTSPQLLLNIVDSGASGGRIYWSSNWRLYHTMTAAGAAFHWCVTFDGTTLRSYFNGADPQAYVGAATNNNTSAYIGSGYATQFRGTIDDVRAYNRALSATEVEALYGARRWDLYWQPSRRVYLNAGGAPPASTQGPRSYHYMTHVWSK